MNWASDAVVPAYFAPGMSFDDMLGAYKEVKHVGLKSNVSKPVETMNDDSSSDEKKKTSRPLGIRKLAIASTKKVARLPDHSKGVGAKKGKSKSVKPVKPIGHGCFVTVDHLPIGISEEELQSHFFHLGRILKVEIDKSKGHIHFVSKKEAIAVVDYMHGKLIKDQTIQLRLGRH